MGNPEGKWEKKKEAGSWAEGNKHERTRKKLRREAVPILIWWSKEGDAKETPNPHELENWLRSVDIL